MAPFLIWRDFGRIPLRRQILQDNPSFVAAVSLTLALGIGANKVIFSVVSSVLLKPLSFFWVGPNLERLHVFSRADGADGF